MEMSKKRFMIAVLLASGFLVHAREPNNNGVLFQAVRPGSPVTVKEAIDFGGMIDAKNRDGKTPLMVALEWDNLSAVRYLIAAGANLDAQDQEGNTALIMAAKWDELSEVVLELIRVGANLDVQNEYGDTALMTAASFGNLAAVVHLLSRGAQVNIVNEQRKTALIEAAEADEQYIVKIFTDVANLDLDTQDEFGNTALIIAAEFDHLTMVEDLLKAGANPCLKNVLGFTAKNLTSSKKIKNMLNEAMKRWKCLQPRLFE